MFASLILAALAQQVVIPLGKDPPKVERAIAPIETAGPAFAALCKENDDWDKPAPPVRIHGNTYLVGTCGISAILITGTDGHVLIDGGTEAGAELIANNIRKLGFKLSDIKFILNSHEHLDHAGGIARLQRLSGATVVASRDQAKVFESGVAQPGDPQIGLHPPFPAVQVGRIIADGGNVRLGNLSLTAVATPGHTPGALTWTWGSCDGGVCYQLVNADSLSPISRDDYKFSDHPAYVASYRASLQKVAALGCDILLTPHPSQSNMINRMAGRAPLVNGNACKDYAAVKGKALDERLATEAKK